MKIAYVASEITPYASTGGLAEVAGALPPALAGLGHDVVRFMPMYRGVIEKHPEVKPTGIKLVIPVGFHNYVAEIWQAEETAPRSYFIRRDEFFDRANLYNLPHRDYDDNFERFVFFQKAVIALIDHLKLSPDVIHGNDWQCGLLPYFMVHGLQGAPRPRPEPFVFTLHNMAYQGIFPGDDYTLTNLPFNCFSVATVEYYGKINCLKGGITGARAVTTVSPTYANEIKGREWGFGLDGLMVSLGPRVSGILNGIDDQLWNPATDPYLDVKYGPDNLAGKGMCRKAFMAEHGMREQPGTVLLGMVTRLVDQKGMDVVAEAMPEIMSRKNVAMYLLGSGEDKYHDLCQAWQKQWPGRFACHLGYDAKMAHQVMGASDFLLVPSRYEPCGLSQFYAMRYGTLPVVHAVGGLADSVADVKPNEGAGTGIVFRGATTDNLLAAIDRGLVLKAQPAAFSAVQRRAMGQDFSWTRPAREYVRLYESLLAPRAS